MNPNPALCLSTLVPRQKRLKKEVKGQTESGSKVKRRREDKEGGGVTHRNVLNQMVSLLWGCAGVLLGGWGRDVVAPTRALNSVMMTKLERWAGVPRGCWDMRTAFSSCSAGRLVGVGVEAGDSR